ncbi:hypothetical protein CY34DRAFT_18708 [Suillus luteus UH-Slu-Lm8-n1]|uniref:Uncharacterized protein n=1 Tax=Suillus luteus UH-Slu-Lm8-n1 TaxID=930992 RepID=A0A0C9ZU89_9AGAM|nr:hypothetical protein CY34DRAFT_18708 [Suillus luteus UH-Slu-Lm8-n1]
MARPLRAITQGQPSNFRVRTAGSRPHGKGVGSFLEVLPVRQGKQYISQGNLHPTQTPLMLSLALSGITTSAGPMNVTTTSAGSFSPVQNDFLFGREQIDALPRPTFGGQPIVVTILPTDTLAKTFAGMMQSVSKSFLGTAYVPAKVFAPQVVFVSSMPFIIASAAMSRILFILIIIHFRRHEKAFTLVSISAVLHGSNLPRHSALAENSQALVANQRVVLPRTVMLSAIAARRAAQAASKQPSPLPTPSTPSPDPIPEPKRNSNPPSKRKPSSSNGKSSRDSKKAKIIPGRVPTTARYFESKNTIEGGEDEIMLGSSSDSEPDVQVKLVLDSSDDSEAEETQKSLVSTELPLYPQPLRSNLPNYPHSGTLVIPASTHASCLPHHTKNRQMPQNENIELINALRENSNDQSCRYVSGGNRMSATTCVCPEERGLV